MVDKGSAVGRTLLTIMASFISQSLGCLWGIEHDVIVEGTHAVLVFDDEVVDLKLNEATRWSTI